MRLCKLKHLLPSKGCFKDISLLNLALLLDFLKHTLMSCSKF